MESSPKYDELYVISDLHIGGESPYQIFDLGKTLARVIDHLRDSSRRKRVALLLNGDTIDFLAEPNAKYFDPIGAEAKLNRIFHDRAFGPIWGSLQQFVQTNKRNLILTLGNHDLELALPWVRERLLDMLSGGKDPARGRITLAFDGAGYLCLVGNAKVLCVHGNEVDTWNITDYETLRRQGRDLNQGRSAKHWTPNAGTKLVIDVMNDIKRDYPFVDLLKPEVEAVVPTLYALKPSLTSKIGSVLAVGGRLAWDAVRRSTGFLGEDEQAEEAEPQEVDPHQVMESLLRDTFAELPQQHSDVDELLRTAERSLSGRESTSVTVGSDEEEFLGLFGSFKNWILGREKPEILREALGRIGKDQSFVLKHADSGYQRLDEWIGQDIDFLISGHTHLERAMVRRDSDGFYYNAGTWARLIQLTPDVLGSPKRFGRLYKVIEKGTMDALDKEPRLVLRKPAVVSIVAEGSTVAGKLMRVNIQGVEPLLTIVPGSEFTRS